MHTCLQSLKKLFSLGFLVITALFLGRYFVIPVSEAQSIAWKIFEGDTVSENFNTKVLKFSYSTDPAGHNYGEALPTMVGYNALDPDNNKETPPVPKAGNDGYSGSGYPIQGWVWNTNIGWISFGCEDIENLGNPGFCSSVSAYAVYMTPADVDGYGYLRGYAWSPKIGWILFHFADGKGWNNSIQPRAQISDPDGDGFAQITGYAWSPALSYFKLDGAKFPLRAPVEPCGERNGIEFDEGYDKVVCPPDGNQNDPNYQYSHQASVACETGEPTEPIIFTRTDQNDNEPPFPEFLIDTAGLLSWSGSNIYNYCASAVFNGNQKEVSFGIQAEWEPNYTVNESNNITIYKECKAPNTFGAADIKVENTDGTHVGYANSMPTAYLGNQYAYFLSVPTRVEDPADGWTPDVSFELVPPWPAGLTLSDAGANRSLIQWDPAGNDPSVRVTIKLTNCGASPSVIFTIPVSGVNPKSLSACPETVLVGETYSCSVIVDANENPRATLPLNLVADSPKNFGQMHGTMVEVVQPQGDPQSRAFLFYPIDEEQGEDVAWVADSSDKNKTFTFTLKVSNNYGNKSRTYTVTVIDTATPPILSAPMPNSLMNPTFHDFSSNLRYDHELLAGTDPIIREATVRDSDNIAIYEAFDGDDDFVSDPDHIAPYHYVEPSCTDVKGCIDINKNNNLIKIDFNPKDYSLEGKKLTIETEVANQLDPNDQSRRAYEDPNPPPPPPPVVWEDEDSSISALYFGYKPSIDRDKVETALENKFVFNELRTFDLKTISRNCFDIATCPLANFAISGTPQIIAEGVSQGFHEWMVTGQAAGEGMTVDANGILTWTPNVSGERKFNLSVKNDFGEITVNDIPVYVPVPPVIEYLDENYECNVGNGAFNGSSSEFPHIAAAAPNVYRWGIEEVKLNGVDDGRIRIEESGNNWVVKFNGSDQLKLNYSSDPDIARQTADILWASCINSPGNAEDNWEFTIFAENNPGVHGRATFNIHVVDPNAASLVLISNDYLNTYTATKDVLLTINDFDVGSSGVGSFTWTAELYKDDGSTLYPPTGAFSIVPDPGNSRFAIIKYTPSQVDYDNQGTEYYLNVKVIDANNGNVDELQNDIDHSTIYPPNGMPKIQIINAPIPSFVDPWSKVVESTIGGVISVRQEVFGGGDDFTRVGDIQASLTRDQVFGNVLSLIRGVTMLGGPGYRGNIKQSGVKLVNDDNGIALLNDRVLYFKGDTNPNLGGYVTIDDTIKSPTSGVPSNQYINWQNHQTIIVDGANLLIKDNLWPKDDNGTLDIVVLRRPNQNRGVAGNILIDNDVTNIKANIFADGGVFSYDGEKYTDTEIQTEITNFGYPKYMITKTACPDPVLDYLAYVDCMDGDDGGVENLKHQFKLLGSIYSRNTIGGAKHSNPNDPKSNFISTGSVNGYGEALTSIEEALAYDLKLFRFYHLNFMRCELDGVPGTIEGVEFDGTLTPGTCEHDFSLDTEDQVICREAAVDARMEIDGQACFGANNWSLNNQGVIIEYQPYAILSPVFRLAR